MKQQDPLGAAVALGAVVGLVALGLLSGPERSAAVSTGGAVAAPVTTEAPRAPAATEEPEAEIERAVPLQVRIGAITVDAPVVPVGLEEDLAMEIPARVAEIGWYDPDGLGVAPGSTGTAVLAGHVDSRQQGRGALYDLRDLRVGEIVELDLSDGVTQRWRITEVTLYPKDVLPYDELFVWTGPPRLAIITCGGTFDRGARSYDSNIVAYAEPVEGPSAALAAEPA